MFPMLILAAAVLGAEPLPDAATELKSLQGKWVVVRGEKNGKSVVLPADGDKALVVEIRDNKWFLSVGKDGKQEYKGRITIHAGLTPRGMDVESAEKGVEGTVIEKIYKLDGDTLTICANQAVYRDRSKRARPSEFKSADDDTILTVLKRLKK